MRNFTVQKSDFHKVACVEEIPEGAGTIVIAVHGFTSSKESPTVRRLLDRLPAAGIGVVGMRSCAWRPASTAWPPRNGM